MPTAASAVAAGASVPTHPSGHLVSGGVHPGAGDAVAHAFQEHGKEADAGSLSRVGQAFGAGSLAVGGFQTAQGAVIRPSASALAHAGRMLEDLRGGDGLPAQQIPVHSGAKRASDFPPQGHIETAPKRPATGQGQSCREAASAGAPGRVLLGKSLGAYTPSRQSMAQTQRVSAQQKPSSPALHDQPATKRDSCHRLRGESSARVPIESTPLKTDASLFSCGSPISFVSQTQVSWCQESLKNTVLESSDVPKDRQASRNWHTWDSPPSDRMNVSSRSHASHEACLAGGARDVGGVGSVSSERSHSNTGCAQSGANRRVAGIRASSTPPRTPEEEEEEEEEEYPTGLPDSTSCMILPAARAQDPTCTGPGAPSSHHSIEQQSDRSVCGTSDRKPLHNAAGWAGLMPSFAIEGNSGGGHGGARSAGWAESMPRLKGEVNSVGGHGGEGHGLPFAVGYSKGRNISYSKWRNLGLPSACVDLFIAKGIREPYDWQVDMLTSDALLKERNFVYALPTSAGKSFVAEVTLLRKLLQYVMRPRNRWDMSMKPCKCLLVMPFVSLCQEKKEELEIFGDRLGFLVEAFYNHMGKFPLPPRTHQLCVCTIEKADRLVMSLIEAGRAEELGLVLVDEIHFIGADSRGSLLEMMLSKLRQFCPRVHIVGMSATLPNLDDMKKWLGAESWDGNRTARPVRLEEHVVCGGELISKDSKVKRLPSPTVDDPDGIVRLVTESIAGPRGAGDGSVLIFCPTIKDSQKLAQKLAGAFELAGNRNASSVQGCVSASVQLPPGLHETIHDKRLKVVDRLRAGDGSEASCMLPNCVRHGVAFHNSALSREERKLIETAFKEGTLNVLASTSTLAAGVNLPAGRVIITKPLLGIEPLKAATYKQMVGRAGRAGFGHITGESFLMCKPAELERCKELMWNGPPEVRSQLMAPVCRLGDKSSSSSSCGSAKAKCDAVPQQYPDVFLRAVLCFVAAGRLPYKGTSGGMTSAAEVAGPFGRDGVEVRQVQSFIRSTFFGVVWERVEKATGRTPDAATIHISPFPSTAVARVTAGSGPTGTESSVDAGAHQARKSLDDIVADAIAQLQEKKLIVQNQSPDRSPASDSAGGLQPHQHALQAVGAAASVSDATAAVVRDVQHPTNRMHATWLGRAIYLSGLEVDVGIEVGAYLEDARRQGLILVDQLHLLFLITPCQLDAERIFAGGQFWTVLGRMWVSLFLG